MNAPTKFPLDVEPAAPIGKPVPTPADLEIVVRDRRFGRDKAPPRWWLNNDPIATAWHNALSATFPRGEALFIESVKAFREGVPPKLEAEIRAFVKQEINHTREHIVLNKAAADAGYDMDRIDARIEELMFEIRKRPAIVNLCATMALEHYTAMMAHEFLANPKHFAGGDPETIALWRWHAIEEIEHKGVAFDTFKHATRDWSDIDRSVPRPAVCGDECVDIDRTGHCGDHASKYAAIRKQQRPFGVRRCRLCFRRIWQRDRPITRRIRGHRLTASQR